MIARILSILLAVFAFGLFMASFLLTLTIVDGPHPWTVEQLCGMGLALAGVVLSAGLAAAAFHLDIHADVQDLVRSL